MRRIAGPFAALLLAFPTCCVTAALADEAAPLRWRIVVNGGADDHGEIVLALAQGGAVATEIPVAIPKGTPENAVAERIEGAIRRALPESDYAVERKGGEKIYVTPLRGAADFELGFVRSTVPGTEVSVERQ